MASLARMFTALVILLICSDVHPSVGQPAPAPALDCSGALSELLDCLDFVTGANSTLAPSCCTGLASVATGSPVCLCEFISPTNANESESLGINSTLALELPTLCNINASPSACAAILGTPSSGPSPAPLTFTPAPATLVPALSPPRGSPVPAPGTPTPVPFPAPTPTLSPAPFAAPVVSPPSTSTPVVAPAPILTPPAGTPVPVPSPFSVSSPPVSPLAPAPSPVTTDCSTEIAKIASCLSYVRGTSDAPSESCCTNLGSVLSTAPTCLCELASSSGYGISNLNITRALQLPEACSISSVDATSLCAGLLPPPSAPAVSPGSGNSPGSSATRNYGSSWVSFVAVLLPLVLFIVVQ